MDLSIKAKDFLQDTRCPSLWPSGIGSRLGRNRLWARFLAVSDIYSMFIEPTITWVPSGFSGYIWLDTKIVLKKTKNFGIKAKAKDMSTTTTKEVKYFILMTFQINDFEGHYPKLAVLLHYILYVISYANYNSDQWCLYKVIQVLRMRT